MNRSGYMTGSWSFKLIVINVVVYILQSSLLAGDNQILFTYYFGLIPKLIIEKGFIWQFFTYMFLHGSFMHIFVNMYALLIFGISIEETWGTKKFLLYYVITGTGAGVTIFLLNIFLGGQAMVIPTIGASGAIFGLLIAFGILFPDAQILLFFVLPIRAKYLVILYGGFEFYSLMTTMGSSNISHIGHLGGLLFGLIFFAVEKRRGITFKAKKIRSNFNSEIRKPDKSISPNIEENKNFLINILKKIKTGGINSLNDDEYQHMQYLLIMYDEENENICVEEDFNYEDDYCLKCENIMNCIVREIKKYK